MEIEEKIKLLKNLFKGRTDAYVLFNHETEEYFKRDELVNDELIGKHITGEKSIAIYPITPNENTCSFGVLDLDLKDTNLAKSVSTSFDYFKIPFCLEESKSKGYHFHVFFDEPVLASKVKRLLEIVKEHSAIANNDKAEIFPKQENISDEGYGSAILLPFSGTVSEPFLDPKQGFKPFEDQWSVLSNAKKMNEGEVDKIIGNYKNDKEKNDTIDRIQKELREINAEKEIDFPCENVADILNSTETTKWIVNSLVPTDGLSMLVGKPKQFKTWILLEMAKCVARGSDFLNHFTTKMGKVLYIDEENGRSILKERMNCLGINPSDNITFMVKEFVDFYSDTKTEALKKKVDKINPILIIIDNFINIHSAQDENSSTEMMKVVKNIKLLLSPERGIIVSHHCGHKGSRIRGASAISADLTSEIHIAKNLKGLKMDLARTRHREIKPFLVNIGYDSSETPNSFTYSEEAPLETQKQRIVDILKEKDATNSELAEELDTEKTEISRTTKRMIGKEIEVIDKGAHGAQKFRIKK